MSLKICQPSQVFFTQMGIPLSRPSNRSVTSTLKGLCVRWSLQQVWSTTSRVLVGMSSSLLLLTGGCLNEPGIARG